MAKREIVEPARPAQDGDFVVIDYEGFKDGQPFAETAKTENFTLKIGQGTIGKDFDDQLTGMQPEESKEFTVNFPEDYFNEKLKGLEISFQVTLNEIREEVLPAIDDALAKKTGAYENLDSARYMCMTVVSISILYIASTSPTSSTTVLTPTPSADTGP